MARKVRFDKMHSFGCSQEHKIQIAQKGIKAEKFRQFIETYGIDGEGRNVIKSSEWKRLRDILDRVPALQLVGDVGSGKSWLVRNLISEDKNHIFILLDAHDEYDLPVVNSISLDIKQSCRIKLPDQPAGAVGLFAVYYNLIMNQQFPKNYCLVVEEALRYKNSGIKNLLAESRKFLKVLCISQEQIVTYVPSITVEPYSPIKI